MHNILNKGIIENISRSLLNPRGQKCKSINKSCNCSKALIESRYKDGILVNTTRLHNHSVLTLNEIPY